MRRKEQWESAFRREFVEEDLQRVAALAESLEVKAAEMLEEWEFGVGQDRSGAGCVEQMSEKEERRTEEKDMEANDGTEKENGIGTRMSVTRS